MNQLHIPCHWPVTAHNAGLFISRGTGRHPSRVIDSYELIVVRSGVLHIREEETLFAVSAGESLLLYPGRMHGGTADYSPELAFYWLHFTLSPLGEEANATAGAHESLFVPQQTRPARPEVVYELFQRFLHDQEVGRLTPLSGNLLLLLLLAEVTSDRETCPASPNVIATQVDLLIGQRFTQSLTTRDIAASVGCNPDYLGRVYKAASGCTVTEALNNARIREARRLLRDSAMEVSEIASACGFTSHNYFCRVFKRYQGMSPLAYRQLHTRAHVITS
jgi:AraC-like DNA-binding protein